LPLEIIPYDESHHPAFHALNLEWLVQYDLAEELDLRVLADPKGEILDQGGFIWVAVHEGMVIGTAALVKAHDQCYELAKMSVAAQYRGRGIARKLIEICLETARKEGATKIELFSNHQLTAALKLYERLGFRYIPVIDSPFLTADIKMEFVLHE
jgi:ribosomal protein S18 acetylase RimI-like enzyme